MKTKWIMLSTIWTALAVTACGDDDGSTPAPNETSGSETLSMGPSSASTSSGTNNTNGPGATGATGATGGITGEPNTSDGLASSATTSGSVSGPQGSDAGIGDAGGGSDSWSVGDAGVGDAGTPGDAGPVIELTDGEILAIVQTVNTGEIAQGELAAENALAASVADYAELMVTSHTTAQSELEVIAMDREIEPESNMLASNIEASAEQVLEQLTELPAETQEFDLAYMASQVSQHTVVLETLRAQLIPQADDPELVAALETLELEVAAHLDMAEDVVNEITNPEQ